MNILITGSTGFIGKRLVFNLAKDNHCYLLVREKSILKAKKYFKNLNVTLISYDLNTDSEIPKEILDVIDYVVHLGALYKLDVKSEDAKETNIKGLKSLINQIKKSPKIKFFHHISTYAVNKSDSHVILEDDLLKSSYNDYYSMTKNNAESILYEGLKGSDINIRIYRPCVIIGDSITGEIDKIDGLYYFWDLFNVIKKINRFIPIKILPLYTYNDAILPLMPVDILTNALNEMILSPQKGHIKTYHIMPKENLLVKDVAQTILNHMGVNTKIIPLRIPFFFPLLKIFFKIPVEIKSYMCIRNNFDTQNFDKDYGNITIPKFKDYAKNLLLVKRP